MACRQINFQTIQHSPAIAIGQMKIERDGVRFHFTRHRQSGSTARSHKDFESFFVRRLDQNARIIGIIFHNQNNAIA